MATSFPSSLDSFTNPSASDALDSVSVPHADQHANLNDAMEAVQAKLGVGAGTIGDTSTTYTPTWTSSGTAPTLGNSTLSGRYIKMNKLVWVQILFIRGSTATNGTGIYYWSLPSGITARAGLYGFMSQGVARLYDASPATVYIGQASFYGGATDKIMAYTSSNAVGATSPFTFATNDEVVMTFTYEAA